MSEENIEKDNIEGINNLDINVSEREFLEAIKRFGSPCPTSKISKYSNLNRNQITYRFKTLDEKDIIDVVPSEMKENGEWTDKKAKLTDKGKNILKKLDGGDRQEIKKLQDRLDRHENAIVELVEILVALRNYIETSQDITRNELKQFVDKNEINEIIEKLDIQKS